MSIIPYTGMVDAALKLKHDTDLWIAIGKTTPWSNDAAPPPDSLTAEGLVDVIAYKRVDMTSLAVPDPSGAIVFQDSKYDLVDDADAIPRLARWCYVRGSLNGTETNHAGTAVANATFRQTGLFSGLIPSSGFGSELVLLPNQVDNPGRLIFYSNHVPRTHASDLNDVIEIVVSMIPPAPCDASTSSTSTV